MKSTPLLIVLTAVALMMASCEQPPAEPAPDAEAAQKEEPAAEAKPVVDPTPGEVVATGVFMGRSGKPMKGARLVLGEPIKDDQFDFTRIEFPATVKAAVTDADGKFEFTGFTPGEYTIAYKPGGGHLFPAEMRIRVLAGTTDSIAPLLVDAELGTNKPFTERKWGQHFTLLEGHTLYSQGAKMKIQNATARMGAQGPFVEIRERRLWTIELEDNSEIKFEAWSY